MKTLKVSIWVFLSFLFVLPGFSFRYNYYDPLYKQYSNAVFYPDVMGYVNILDTRGDDILRVTVNLDSMPVFPNFPKIFSGGSFEGSIYCNMDSDPEFEIVYNIGYSIQVLNSDGTSVPGWPKSISYPVEGAPAFGDIDGDGQGEIVVTGSLSSAGMIWAYKRNGTICTGFPVNHGYSTRTPVLADVNNDGKLEIIVNLRTYPTGKVYVYKGDGTVLSGWPKNIESVPASSAAAGDIDNDGIPEIIAESYYALYAWKSTGDSIPGFPFFMSGNTTNSYSSPVLADLDGDNKREIIFGTHVLGGGGWVYVLKNNGAIFPGWPKGVGNWIYDPPAVGYIDNDNILDIAVGDQILSGTPMDRIFAWDRDGLSLTGFPTAPVNAINAQIILADINNDNQTELIIDDNSTTADTLGKYLCFKNDGSQLTSWNLRTKGATFFNTPCLLDINRDNILEMVGAGVQGISPQYTNVYLWSLGVAYNPVKIQIPMWQYNTRHNGVYGDVNLVGISQNKQNVPEQYSLYQNYPNPFNPVTKIKFDIAKKEDRSQNSEVKLKIYDITGKEIATLVNENLSPGTYEVEWNAFQYTSGVYFYRLQSEEFTDTKRMIFLK